MSSVIAKNPNQVPWTTTWYAHDYDGKYLRDGCIGDLPNLFNEDQKKELLSFFKKLRSDEPDESMQKVEFEWKFLELARSIYDSEFKKRLEDLSSSELYAGLSSKAFDEIKAGMLNLYSSSRVEREIKNFGGEVFKDLLKSKKGVLSVTNRAEKTKQNSRVGRIFTNLFKI